MASGALGETRVPHSEPPTPDGANLRDAAPKKSRTNFPKPLSSAPSKNVGSNPSAWHGRYTAACSPFNGPGGSSNPYFVLSQTINGTKQNMAAWLQGVGSQSCSNGCTASFTIDPIAYTVPGDYYDADGNLVGPQANPFNLVITDVYADPAHAGDGATRTILGVPQWGTFSNPVNVLGTTVYGWVRLF